MKKLLLQIFLSYLRILAHIQLFKIRPKIVGITGSVGKTSLRDAIVLVLKQNYVVKSSDQANSETGIPLDILGLHMKDYSLMDWLRVGLFGIWQVLTNWDQYEVYVAELGVDSPFPPKNMSYLLRIIRPDVGVFLNVSTVHSELFERLVTWQGKLTPEERNFRIRSRIGKEKGLLVTTLLGDKTAVFNIDDEIIAELENAVKAKKITFGKGSTAHVRIVDVSNSSSGFTAVFAYKGTEYQLAVDSQVLPREYAYTFAAAIGVGLAFGISVDASLSALKSYTVLSGRMSILRGIENTVLIDSSYNASRLSMIAGIRLAKEIAERDNLQVILALGDMREMGRESEREHQKVADEAVKIARDIVLVGPLMEKHVLTRALEKGFSEDRIHTFRSSRSAGLFIKEKLISGGEVILAKGSQNTIFMENVIEVLLEDPHDKAKLCRRGAYWDKRREDAANKLMKLS